MFHQGEIELQQRLGAVVEEEHARQFIHTELKPEALPFIENQECVYLSATYPGGDIWLFPLIGKNHIQVKALNMIHINLENLLLPLDRELIEYANEVFNVGLLFLDALTRRRYRVNGIAKIKGDIFEVIVMQAYPNCPKYIQSRSVSYSDKNEELRTEGSSLNEHLKNVIINADTFYVASRSEHGDMDTSHRGGNPRFITVTEEGKLRIPDYQGNGLYNTLGNFLYFSKAGLLFFNYPNNEIIQLTGNVEIFIDDEFPDKRYWEFTVVKWKSRSNGVQLKEQLFDYSPYNPE